MFITVWKVFRCFHVSQEQKTNVDNYNYIKILASFVNENSFKATSFNNTLYRKQKGKNAIRKD